MLKFASSAFTVAAAIIAGCQANKVPEPGLQEPIEKPLECWESSDVGGQNLAPELPAKKSAEERASGISAAGSRSVPGGNTKTITAPVFGISLVKEAENRTQEKARVQNICDVYNYLEARPYERFTKPNGCNVKVEPQDELEEKLLQTLADPNVSDEFKHSLPGWFIFHRVDYQSKPHLSWWVMSPLKKIERGLPVNMHYLTDGTGQLCELS